jgi:hypothetical protein
MRNLSNKATGMLPQTNLQQEMSNRRGLRSSGLLKLTGGGSNEQSTQAVMQVILNNIDDEDHVIAIHPGLLDTIAEIQAIAGVAVDAIAKDGVVIVDKVTCKTKNTTSLGFFQRFVNNNPQRIIRMQVSANEADQLDEAIVLAKISPTTKLSDFPITPSHNKKATDTNVKLVVIDLANFQLDDQSVMYVNVLAGRTLTMNLYLGACRNDAATLEELASIK